MDRKGIIAVALAIAVLIWWQMDNSRRTAAQLAEKQRAEELAKLNAPVPDPAAPVASTPGAPATTAPAVEPAAAEEIEPVSTPAVEYEFTNLGGGIQRAVLKQHQAEHSSNV